jgi:hypothetical protein
MTNIIGECKKGKMGGNANLNEEAVNDQVSSVARTKKQNIAQFLPNIAQNVASDNKQNFNQEM